MSGSPLTGWGATSFSGWRGFGTPPAVRTVQQIPMSATETNTNFGNFRSFIGCLPDRLPNPCMPKKWLFGVARTLSFGAVTSQGIPAQVPEDTRELPVTCGRETETAGLLPTGAAYFGRIETSSNQAFPPLLSDVQTSRTNTAAVWPGTLNFIFTFFQSLVPGNVVVELRSRKSDHFGEIRVPGLNDDHPAITLACTCFTSKLS